MKISSRWLKLFKLIPGYSPVATAAPGEWFDEAAADKACQFFPDCLKHIEGELAGEPFTLEPWQQAVTGCLFGWKRKDATRRYRQLFLLVGRGNGKTPWAAGIVIYIQACEDERGQQNYIVASDADQAAKTFRHATGFVSENPDLDNLLRVYKATGMRAIVTREEEASTTRVVSSDAAGKHGQVPHVLVGDEVHAWKDQALMAALETGFAKKGRRQPLRIWITTADTDRPSPCNLKHDEARMVRDNGGDPEKPGFDSSFLPVLYENPPEADWTDERTWERANPNMDVTVDREALRRDCQKAIEQPPLQAEFKRLHCNIRTSSQTVYIPLEVWDRNAGPADVPHGTKGYGGLDMSSKIDLTALALLFAPVYPGDVYRLKMHYWLPRNGLRERCLRDKVPYDAWAEAGYITLIDGNVIDESVIERHIVETHEKRHPFVELGYDKWNAQGLGIRLLNIGVPTIDVPQTIGHLTCGTKGLLTLATDNKLAHGGDPVLRWMMSCTDTVGDKNQNLRPVKPDRATGKRIDGVVAAIIAAGRALVKADGTSVYESRGVLAVNW